MSHFRITFRDGRRPVCVRHRSGSQNVFTVIDEAEPSFTMPNGILLSLEADGWADDQACVGDTLESGVLDVECITEEEFRRETRQEDMPAYLLEDIVTL